MIKVDEIPVFILCGGLGTRIKEMTEFVPKPMIPIGNRPILWHIMRSYHMHGFRKFILCTGFKSDVIKSYFLNYSHLNSDFTIDLKTNHMTIHSVDHNEDWEVTVAFTGEDNMTGSRIAIAAKKYLGLAENAAVTYGDGLTNANLTEELYYHLNHDKLGTVLGINPPSRFGEIRLDGEVVTEFTEKPEFKEKWVNGGFFFFKRDFFERYLSADPQCVLEKHPLVNLSNDNQLNLYKHNGFWACMDTQRDWAQLEDLWKSGLAPWAHKVPFVNYATSDKISRPVFQTTQ